MAREQCDPLKGWHPGVPGKWGLQAGGWGPHQVQAEVTGPTHEERVAELVERLAELDATQALLR